MTRVLPIRTIKEFQNLIWSYYAKNKRLMPWRDNTSSYYVVVSEIMLQQTQVDRVMKKFPAFIARFPNWQSLAKASTKDVLEEWSGLGYNRRALFLKRIAETITNNGTAKESFPATFEALRELPGIGTNTAGSILAFAHNIPYPFIETNIRSVFIHHFFKKHTRKINDLEILSLVQQTLDAKNPREWYYALMDYGSHIKRNTVNPSRKSAHHIKQTPFKGSNRELRSKILKSVMKKAQTEKSIIKTLAEYPAENIVRNLKALAEEGFLKKRGTTYSI